MSHPDMSEPSSAIADTPTPGDIEAALSDLRAQLGTAAPAPEAALARPVEAPRRPGWGGTAALMLAAALLGGGDDVIERQRNLRLIGGESGGDGLVDGG